MIAIKINAVARKAHLAAPLGLYVELLCCQAGLTLMIVIFEAWFDLPVAYFYSFF